jgi:preprotein translocase subunit SecD
MVESSPSARRLCQVAAALFAAALTLYSPGAPAAATPPPRAKVEIRLARKSAAPGFAAASSGRFAGKVFVAEKALFTNRDFTGARVANTGGGVALLLSFTPKAARRLADFTRKSRGQELALLLDGRVLWVAVMGEPITGGEMALMTDLPYSDAKAVADALRPTTKL